MANFTFNIAKGRVAYYATLPAANDALVLVPIQTAGIEAEATLRDYTNLASLLAGSSDEQTTMGRKVVTSVTVTVDNTNERVDLDFADPVWSAATGPAVSKLLVCYDPNTTSGTDSELIPLTAHDFVVTPDGSDITGNVAAAGFWRSN